MIPPLGNTLIDLIERRDSALSRRGLNHNFTGIDDPYEAPRP